jgi:hypothetical protein
LFESSLQDAIQAADRLSPSRAKKGAEALREARECEVPPLLTRSGAVFRLMAVDTSPSLQTQREKSHGTLAILLAVPAADQSEIGHLAN